MRIKYKAFDDRQGKYWANTPDTYLLVNNEGGWGLWQEQADPETGEPRRATLLCDERYGKLEIEVED